MLPKHFLHRPDGTLCALLFDLQGGGVNVVKGTYAGVNINAVANFEGCHIYDNTATYVCRASLNLFLNFHPLPGRNVTRSAFWLAG